MNESALRSIPEFVGRVIEQLRTNGVDVGTLLLDHVCYRVETDEEYRASCDFLSELGKLLVESIVGGRLISTYKLIEPVVTADGRHISVIEVPMPKHGNKSYSRGWEHAEFVLPDSVSIAQFQTLHSSLRWDESGARKLRNADIRLAIGNSSVKFHKQALEFVIEEELKEARDNVVLLASD
jgi:predicted metalloenzyme YecM